MTGQTYSPYRRDGRQIERPVDFGQATPPVRRSGLSQAILAAAPAQAAPARRSAASGAVVMGGLANRAARKWVVFGAIGIVSSLLLTVAVALLSTRGVASADAAPAETVRQSRVTLVREIGGLKASPTPGTGTTAAAPAAPARLPPMPAAPRAPPARRCASFGGWAGRS